MEREFDVPWKRQFGRCLRSMALIVYNFVTSCNHTGTCSVLNGFKRPDTSHAATNTTSQSSLKLLYELSGFYSTLNVAAHKDHRDIRASGTQTSVATPGTGHP